MAASNFATRTRALDMAVSGPLAREELAVGDVSGALSDHLEDWASPSATSLREGGALESPATTHLVREQTSIPCGACRAD